MKPRWGCVGYNPTTWNLCIAPAEGGVRRALASVVRKPDGQWGWFLPASTTHPYRCGVEPSREIAMRTAMSAAAIGNHQSPIQNQPAVRQRRG